MRGEPRGEAPGGSREDSAGGGDVGRAMRGSWGDVGEVGRAMFRM